MPDVVTSEYVYSGHRRKLLHLTGVSDGSGESGVVKGDISALTFNGGQIPSYSAIDLIDYNIQGFSSVRLFWDHTTDDEIAVLPGGSGCLDFYAYGGKVDPRSAGGTGDILLSSFGAVNGATYDILIHFRPKA